MRSFPNVMDFDSRYFHGPNADPRRVQTWKPKDWLFLIWRKASHYILNGFSGFRKMNSGGWRQESFSLGALELFIGALELFLWGARAFVPSHLVLFHWFLLSWLSADFPNSTKIHGLLIKAGCAAFVGPCTFGWSQDRESECVSWSRKFVIHSWFIMCWLDDSDSNDLMPLFIHQSWINRSIEWNHDRIMCHAFMHVTQLSTIEDSLFSHLSWMGGCKWHEWFQCNYMSYMSWGACSIRNQEHVLTSGTDFSTFQGNFRTRAQAFECQIIRSFDRSLRWSVRPQQWMQQPRSQLQLPGQLQRRQLQPRSQLQPKRSSWSLAQWMCFRSFPLCYILHLWFISCRDWSLFEGCVEWNVHVDSGLLKWFYVHVLISENLRHRKPKTILKALKRYRELDLPKKFEWFRSGILAWKHDLSIITSLSFCWFFQYLSIMMSQELHWLAGMMLMNQKHEPLHHCITTAIDSDSHWLCI